MIESDTIKLLRECDSGIKMGVSSIDDSMKYVQSDKLRQLLENSKERHEAVGGRLVSFLHEYSDSGKEPPVMAKVMSKVKTEFKLAIENADSAVAESMIDGCNMGIKSLSRYLNQYQAADENSKDLAKELIGIEESLSAELRPYL
ncbi:MAG: hypothetical protein IJ806_05325 [Ruminococcus sp.]|nr:hypothetical protein [Ruminococcus sp.]